MVKYRDGDGNLNSRLTGCIVNPVASTPLTFLGSTVLSFNASLGIGPTQESTLSVELVNDCKVSGADNPSHFPTAEYFYGAARLGGPVFFGPVGNFQFGGILTGYDAQQSSGGQIFSAKVSDPRSLLDHAVIIVDSFLEGPIKHRNYFNVYAYYEYNILPTGLKLNPPHPIGIPVTGLAFSEQAEDGKGLTYEPYASADTVVTPPGNAGVADCEVFGTADTNERGMSARKVVQALKEMDPLIYSPNYGESYDPLLTNKDIVAAVGRLHHELHVFRLKISDFPEPPPYMRISGPSITILELLTQICDVKGDDFNVYLEQSTDGGPHWIRIQTKNIDEDLGNAQTIRDTILNFNGIATDISFGEELRTDKSRTILLGEQEHILAECTSLQFFFGEDLNGDPVVPVYNNDNGCGFEVAFDITTLNERLSCPLFDPLLHDDGELTDAEKVLTKKVVVTESDIRAVLSSAELWQLRMSSEQEDLRTQFPTTAQGANTVDFNTVLRYNFQDILSPLISELMTKIQFNTDEFTRRNGFVPEVAIKAAIDALNVTDMRSIRNLSEIRKKDLDTVYDWFHSIANTYYGKQYLVTLPTGVCAVPAGLYDEDYFGIGDSNIPPSLIEYTDIKCQDIIPEDDPRLSNKIFRPTQYTHVPTNEGGWADPCTPVLGLESDDLTFFRTEDLRIGPFARFQSRDIVVRYQDGVVGTTDLAPPGPGESVLINNLNQTIVGGDTPTAFTIEGVCGEVDISAFSPDDYLIIRDLEVGGNCGLPINGLTSSGTIEHYNVTDNPQAATVPLKEVPNDDLDFNLFLRASVEEKLYIVSSTDPACEEDINNTACKKVAKAVIKFDAPCLKKPCADKPVEQIADAMLSVLYTAGLISEQVIQDAIPTEEPDPPPASSGGPTPEDKAKAFRDRVQKFICGVPVDEGVYLLSSALDASSLNNKGFHPSADLPTAVCIPLRSNISAYGPWYSPNFNDSAGGIDFQRNNDLAPWNYSSMSVLNYVAAELIKEAQVNRSEAEKGSITHPGAPLLNLGFLENGPNLTSVNVSWGGNGITSNYEFQTYTPKFGGLKTLEAQQIREGVKNRQRAQKFIKDQIITKNRIQRKLFNFGRNVTTRPRDAGRFEEKGTLQRIMMGEMYDFSVIREGDPASGNIIGSGQRTVVGTDTLQKSKLEMKFGYDKKAYMSLDGFFSPVSISGDGELPMFAIKYSGYLQSFKSNTIAPNPPVFLSGDPAINSGTGIGIEINQTYLNPLQNNFGTGEHPQHSGRGAGHTIDMVGRGTGVPVSGTIMNLYGQQDWDERYADDYRFLGLKGPLVLHSWGYDTDGKPVPNIVDSEESIRQSGTFAHDGLKDYFLQDWLHKPATWPVAPIDLRFDRERGVWVSPPQNKIIVTETVTNIPEYGSGTGILINSRGGHDYGKDIYDQDGNLIEATGIQDNYIVIEDRLGLGTEAGEKRYAYFDSFTSTYLLMGAGGSPGVKLGKYNGYWSNAHGRNVKTVTLYKQPTRSLDPYDWVPETDSEGNNVTVLTINMFTYLPSKVGSDRSLWCAVIPISSNPGWYNQTKYEKLYLLLAAEG
jgi:hypothetical protein